MKSNESQTAGRCQQTILALLVVAALAGILLVWAAIELRECELRRQAHEKIVWDSKTYSGKPFPWYSSWLHNLAGNDESYDLTFLVLNNFAVDDDTLATLAAFGNLEQLWLNGEIVITDKGLKHLTRLKRLQDLSLGDASVSAGAVHRLQQALPQCKIDWASPAAKAGSIRTPVHGPDGDWSIFRPNNVISRERRWPKTWTCHLTGRRGQSPVNGYSFPAEPLNPQ